MSKPKGPPYASGLPYLKRSTETYCRTNRPTWTSDDIKWTALTIWYGDNRARDYYNARVRKKRLYPLPTPNIIPTHPYNLPDVNHARANRVLPPQRDATGIPIPLSPPQPQGPSAQPQGSSSIRPINQYPFDFWTPLPWDQEPADATLGSSIKDIKGTNEAPEQSNQWMENSPDMWPTGDESMWRGGKFLGGGTFGCAGLWCEVDATNHVQRHIVVKEVRTVRRREWRDPVQWRDRLPREIRIHQLVDANRPPAMDLRGHRNLARHLGYRLMMEQRRYRLYLNFYAGGDLYEAFKGHFGMWKEELRTKWAIQKRKSEKHEKRMKSNKESASGRRPFEESEENEKDDEELEEPTLETLEVIPERFIWHVFSQLIDACEVLQAGGLAPAAAADVAGKPITHLDIGLRNVFLDPSIGNNFPNAVLSDFGLSFYSLELSNPTFADNPHEYIFDQLGPNYAPEHQFLRGTPGNWTRLGEKTDVWSIGALIWMLLANTYVNGGPHREVWTERGSILNEKCAGSQNFGRMGSPGGDPPFTGLFYPAFKRYSDALKSLVARCLNWEPLHRPGLEDIRREIDHFLENNPVIRDDRNAGPLLINALEDGLRINDVFQAKRRIPT
ncbi:Nn.00g003710.m01.CDS01 [Neocucurbitaria sp. VM-36]